ncbi:MAG: hypothetical protein WCZ23_09350 [Rhodospirillaceae bacterium]
MRLVPATRRQAAAALDAPRDRARQCFAAWMDEAGRARAAVEARARAAVAECYRFGLIALDQPEAFSALCARLDIRPTRADRAGNPFIRVVKAVFGRDVEDGWQSITDSQVNKYATILHHAHGLNLAPDAVEDWLSLDYTPAGEAVPMSISRRLREARGGLPPPLLSPPAGALHAALDRLAGHLEVTPLALRGLGAPTGAALIVVLGEGEAVRLSGLPEEAMLAVLGTLERHTRRAASPPPPADGPFRRLAGVLRDAPFIGPDAAARLVHHRERCAVLVGTPGGPVARIEWAGDCGLPRHRVFALLPEALSALRRAARAPGAETLEMTNYPRPGGVLEQTVHLSADAAVPVTEVPPGAVPDAGLGDIGPLAWDARADLGRDGLLVLARFDSRAASWKRDHVTRTGRSVVQRASRIAEIAYGPGTVVLSLRRGPGEPACLPLAVRAALPAGDRITRRDLGRAARLLLKRGVIDGAGIAMAAGRVWMLWGRNPRTGETVYLALPLLDAAGRPVRNGFQPARFEADLQAFGERLNHVPRGRPG